MMKHMKGISAVIATLLMLVITVALAITAYGFITGIFTQQTSELIEIGDVTCIEDANVGAVAPHGVFNIVIRNLDEFQTVSVNQISISIDGTPIPLTHMLSRSAEPIPVNGGSTVIALGGNDTAGPPPGLPSVVRAANGAHQVRVLGPSGRAQVATVTC